MSDIDAIQQGLEKALQAAAQADDRELSGRVRDEGRRLVFLLIGLMRTTRIHDTENAAFEAPSREFANVLRALHELLGAVHVICVEDQIYVNDIRLRVKAAEQHLVDALVKELARHDVGGMSFHTVLTAEAAKQMAFTLSRPAADSAPRTALATQFARFADIELQGTYHFRIGKEPEKVKKDFDDTMRRAALVVREAVENLAANRVPNPLPIRRAVIDMVDSIEGNEGRAAAANMRKVAENYGDQHLLAVSTFSLMIGEALGLGEAALSDLGVAAMMHDVGYTQVPDKTGHATAGARMLLKQKGFHEAKLRRILLMLDHHRGYQRDAAGRLPSLFSRIVHIADDYDSLTAKRPGQLPPVSPAAALALMWSGRSTQYDPDLLALFIQTMGRFPAGSMLALNDGRWAVSVSAGRDREHFATPVVCIMRDADGIPLSGQERIDLFDTREELWAQRLLDPVAEQLDPEMMLNQVFGSPLRSASPVS